jgi:hypothetical protein
MRFATWEDKAEIEKICNDPVMRVWSEFTGIQPYRAEPYLVRPSRVILGEEGCFSLQCIDYGRYVLHADLLPTCRGHAAIQAGYEMLKMMFAETDCMEILTMMPVTIPQAKWIARCVGFKYVFRRERAWPNGNCDIEFYRMTLEDWCLSVPGEAIASWTIRMNDMVQAGNRQKAIEAYNRWARFAMYEQVEEVQLQGAGP